MAEVDADAEGQLGGPGGRSALDVVMPRVVRELRGRDHDAVAVGLYLARHPVHAQVGRHFTADTFRLWLAELLRTVPRVVEKCPTADSGNIVPIGSRAVATSRGDHRLATPTGSRCHASHSRPAAGGSPARLQQRGTPEKPNPKRRLVGKSKWRVDRWVSPAKVSAVRGSPASFVSGGHPRAEAAPPQGPASAQPPPPSRTGETESRGHYDVLGIRRAATESEIRRAYCQQALRTHPDKGGHAAEFHKVHAAFELLSDTQKRTAYDRHLQASGSKDGLGKRAAQVKVSEAQAPEVVDMIAARKLHTRLLTVPAHAWHQEVTGISSTTVEALISWMRPRAKKRNVPACRLGIPQSFAGRGLRITPNGTIYSDLVFENVCIRTLVGTEDFGVALTRNVALVAIRESWRRKTKEEQKMGLSSSDIECGFEVEPTIRLTFRFQFYRHGMMHRSPQTEDPRQFQSWHRAFLRVDSASPRSGEQLAGVLQEARRSLSASRDSYQVLQAKIRLTLEEELKSRTEQSSLALPGLSPALAEVLDVPRDSVRTAVGRLDELPPQERALRRDALLNGMPMALRALAWSLSASPYVAGVLGLPVETAGALLEALPTLTLCRMMPASRSFGQAVAPILQKRISSFIDAGAGLEDKVRSERGRRVLRRRLKILRTSPQALIAE